MGTLILLQCVLLLPGSGSGEGMGPQPRAGGRPGQELQELGFEISRCSMLSKQDQVPGVHPCDGEFRKCFSSSTCVLLGKIHPSD